MCWNVCLWCSGTWAYCTFHFRSVIKNRPSSVVQYNRWMPLDMITQPKHKSTETQPFSKDCIGFVQLVASLCIKRWHWSHKNIWHTCIAGGIWDLNVLWQFWTVIHCWTIEQFLHATSWSFIYFKLNEDPRPPGGHQPNFCSQKTSSLELPAI